MLRDFELLGIRSVAQLARQNPQRLYEKLSRVPGNIRTLCAGYFLCGGGAAKNPRLPAEQCEWWYGAGRQRGRMRKR